MLNINSATSLVDLVKAASVMRAKANKFRVRITAPTLVMNKMDGFEFLCEGADFPFFTYNVETAEYALRKNKSVTKIDYDPVALTFGINSGLFGSNQAMNMFIEWAEIIRTKKGLFGYLDDYAGTVEIDLLDEYLSVYKTAVLNKAFIINAGNLALQLEDDSLATITISFDFQNILHGDDALSLDGVTSGISDFISDVTSSLGF